MAGPLADRLPTKMPFGPVLAEHVGPSHPIRFFRPCARQFLFNALREPLGFYGWFTEDFDTADLKEAKAPLDELG